MTLGMLLVPTHRDTICMLIYTLFSLHKPVTSSAVTYPSPLPLIVDNGSHKSVTLLLTDVQGTL